MLKIEKIKNENHTLIKYLSYNDTGWDKNLQKCSECGDFSKYQNIINNKFMCVNCI